MCTCITYDRPELVCLSVSVCLCVSICRCCAAWVVSASLLLCVGSVCLSSKHGAAAAAVVVVCLKVSLSKKKHLIVFVGDVLAP